MCFDWNDEKSCEKGCVEAKALKNFPINLSLDIPRIVNIDIPLFLLGKLINLHQILTVSHPNNMFLQY